MYFNEGSIGELLSVVNNEDREIIVDCFKSFTEYVNSVNLMEIKIKAAKSENTSGEDFRMLYEALDINRKRKHDSAIVSARILNRLAKIYKIKSIYIGDENDRFEIAEFIGEIVNKVYLDGIIRRYSKE